MQPVVQNPPAPEIVMFDETNPRSLVNLLPEPVANHLRHFTSKNFPKRQLFTMSESELLTVLRRAEKTPTMIDDRVRIKFWIEYDRVQATNEVHMSMANVISNTISRELFYKYYIPRPERLAWMLCPPLDYVAQGEEALRFGINRLREMMEMPIHNKAGILMPGAASAVLQIVKFLDERIYGCLPTREITEARSKVLGAMRRGKPLPVQVSADVKDMLNKTAESLTVEEAFKKLRKLEEEEKKMGIFTGPHTVPVGEEE
jgi:hypothetical protein